MKSSTFVKFLLLSILCLALSLSTIINSIKQANADSVIGTITVGTGPYGAIYDPANGYIYTANVFSNSVSVIDGSTNTVIATITEPAGQTPRELAFNSATGNIYVADVYSNTVSVIDGKTNKLLTTMPTGGTIVDGLAYDSSNGNVYAVNAGSGTVSVIDGLSNKVIGTIPVGSNPLEAEFVPDNGCIYVANEGSASVSVIDGSANKVVGTIDGVPDPVQLVYNPSNHYVYVASHNSNTVSVIDTRTNSVIAAITGLPDPTGVGYNSATGNVYVGNQGSNYVSIISGVTNKVIDSVTVGKGPVSPVFDPKNDNVYVTDFNSNEAPGNTVSVISTVPHADTIPPDTAITSAVDSNGAAVQNGGTTVSSSIQIAFTGTDNIAVAGFQCSIDDLAAFACNSSPVSFSNLQTGRTHTFQVSAVDTSKNVDPIPAIFKWTVLIPSQAIQQLLLLSQSMHLNPAVQAMITGLLNSAASILSDNNPSNDKAACNQLNTLITQLNIRAQNNQITSSQAAQLIQQAQAIRTAIRC
jgi:YVTN family beta-propeller protein